MQVIFIMGVSGVGKSTIGELLAKELNIPYFDGDDFHSEDNIIKMSKGESLNDEDRYEWLLALNTLAVNQLELNGCVIACSSLKEKYRDILKKGIDSRVKMVFLEGSFEIIMERIGKRKDHYMPSTLLRSQFDTLEIPNDALKVNINRSPQEIVNIVIGELNAKSEFGLLGLGVMGKSLARNLAQKGIKISLFNRYVEGVEEDVALNFKDEFDELSDALVFEDVKLFTESLQKPRKIMLMVNAGETVDLVIENILPYLSPNDVLIDGGNSHYRDTARRIKVLKKRKIEFIGTGVSGGEEGALKGPSIMPGGDTNACKMILPFLKKIAARDKDGRPCCAYIGNDGSGHYVKMVHNGMEYAEMQLLAEVYSICSFMGKDPDEIANLLKSWKNNANSYLLEITINILQKKIDDKWVIHTILDKAGNKGTGNWTTIAMAELGVPSTMIASALFARYLSAFKEERETLSKKYTKSDQIPIISEMELLNAYQLARIVNHAQGFKLLKEASITFEWKLNLSEIARIWTNGCIIRSSLMEELVIILKESENILIDEIIVDKIQNLRPFLNKVVSECLLSEMDIPCFTASANYLNGATNSKSSANLIQAQRDFFGAHTFQKVNDPSGEFYHLNWNI